MSDEKYIKCSDAIDLIESFSIWAADCEEDCECVGAGNIWKW